MFLVSDLALFSLSTSILYAIPSHGSFLDITSVDLEIIGKAIEHGISKEQIKKKIR